MDDMNAFEHQVAEEVLKASAPPRSVDAAAVFAAVTTQSPKWRFQTMFSATKFVVAGAIVALCSGFLLAGVLMTQPGDDMPPAVGAASSPTPLAVATVKATPAPERSPSSSSVASAAEDVAAQEAIAANRQSIRLLQNRLDVLRKKRNKKEPDRSEIIFLTGQISALQRDIQLMDSRSTDSVAAEALVLLGELQATLPVGWNMPAVVRDAIAEQRFEDILTAVQAATDAATAVLVADAALPGVGVRDTYRSGYESAGTVEALRDMVEKVARAASADALTSEP